MTSNTLHEIELAMKSRLNYLTKQVEMYTVFTGMSHKQYKRAEMALNRLKKCEIAYNQLKMTTLCEARS